jgi:peroxiredoxin
MSKVALNAPAPDFVLPDFQGNEIRLSDYFGHQNIVLVFNRGFF